VQELQVADRAQVVVAVVFVAQVAPDFLQEVVALELFSFLLYKLVMK
jgi:hypothetical protein